MMTNAKLAVATAVAAVGCCLTATASANAPTFAQDSFTDIPQGSAYYNATEYLRLNNLVKGYMDGSFGPGRRMNRAEFVQLMTNPFLLKATRASDCTMNSGTGSSIASFDDVPVDSWYARPVCIAKMYGIVNGYPDGTFRPNDPITFVEAAKVASKVLELHAQGGADGGADPRWYTVYVLRLSERNSIPTSIKRFDQVITRGEMAEMVYRLAAEKTGLPSNHFENFPNP